MKIAILSDSHDNIWKLDGALARIGEAGMLIHCGDLCSPFIIKRLGAAARDIPVHIVWGNNEGDVRLMCQIASGLPRIHLHGALAELEADGLRVAVNHYPEIAGPLAASGRYDLVCYGHDHTAHQSEVGRCVLLNPGEIMGMNGKSTFAWFDTATRRVRFEEIQ